MATSIDINKKYLDMKNNSKTGTSSYINSMRQNSLNAYQNVLNQKYNNPQNVQAQYNKLQSDLGNYDLAQQQYSDILQRTEAQQRQAALGLQQGQRYLPSQLNMQGLGGTGLSETSQVGLQNAYQNILSQGRASESEQINKLYQDLTSAQRESDLALRQEMAANDKVYRENVIASMAQAQTVDELEKYKQILGGNLDPLTQMQFEARKNLLTQALDKEYAIQHGAYAEEGIDIKDLSRDNFSMYNVDREGSPQYVLFDKLKEAYAKDPSILPDGVVIDINVGGGKNNFLVKNGKLYKTDKPATKGYNNFDFYNKLGIYNLKK